MKFKLVEDLKFYKGIFWIIDEEDLDKNKNYCFKAVSDIYGNSEDLKDIGVAKNGNTYNHKMVWEQLPSNLTHNKPYNYYPRGRVEIHNGVAKIFLNGNINYEEIIEFLKEEFNLISHNGIKKVQIIEDNSNHYLCHLDNGWRPAK